MDIRFDCVFEGKKLFQVYKEVDWPVFTGTFPQCKRFIQVHHEKIAKNRFRERRSPRPVPVPATAP
jgi:hypothetical protein